MQSSFLSAFSPKTYQLTLTGLDHGLDGVDGGSSSDIEGKGVTRKRFDENLHSKRKRKKLCIGLLFLCIICSAAQQFFFFNLRPRLSHSRVLLVAFFHHKAYNVFLPLAKREQCLR